MRRFFIQLIETEPQLALIAEEKSPARISLRGVSAIYCSDMEVIMKKGRKLLAGVLALVMSSCSVFGNSTIANNTVETADNVSTQRPDDKWENKATIAQAGKYKELNYSFLKDYNFLATTDSAIMETFDSVEELKNSTDKRLLKGAYVMVRGYYEPDDGGACLYLIKGKNEKQISVELANGLFAEPIPTTTKIGDENYVALSIKQFGAKGDGINSDNAGFNNTVLFAENYMQANKDTVDRAIIYIPEGEYKCTDQLVVGHDKTLYLPMGASNLSIVGEGDKSVFFTDNDYRKDYGYSEHFFQTWRGYNVYYANFRVEAREVDLYHYMRQFTMTYCDNVYVDNVDLIVPEEAWSGYYYQDKQYSNLCCYCGNKNITVDGCYFEQMSGTYRGANVGVLDIWSHGEEKITIMNCELVGNARDEQIGFFSTSKETAYVKNVDFINNTIRSYSPKYVDVVKNATMRFTIAYNDSVGVEDIHIAGNHFISECDSKFMTFGNVKNCLIEDNIMELYCSYSTWSMIFDTSCTNEDGVICKNNEFFISSYSNHGKGSIVGGGGQMKFIGNRVLLDVPLVFGIYGNYLKDNEFITFKMLGSNQGHGISSLGDKAVCEGNTVTAYNGIGELCCFSGGSEDAVMSFSNNTIYDMVRNTGKRGVWTALMKIATKAKQVDIVGNKYYAPNIGFSQSDGTLSQKIDEEGNIVSLGDESRKENPDGTKTYYNRMFYYRAADGCIVSNLNVKDNVFQGVKGFTSYGSIAGTGFNITNNEFVDTEELVSDVVASKIEIVHNGEVISKIGSDSDKVELKANVYLPGEDDTEILTNDRPVKWYSSVDSIASVDDNGVVTKHKNGTVKIFAITQDGTTNYGECLVTFEDQKIKELNLVDENITLQTGLKNYIEYNLVPENAAKEVIFTSENEEIATVNRYGLVVAKAVGDTKITLKTVDGSNIVKTVNVHVEDTTVRKISMEKSYYELDNSCVGSTYQLKVGSYFPDNAVNKEIGKWVSSNEDILTVDNNGLVTVKKYGVARIDAYSTDESCYGSTTFYVGNPKVSNLYVASRNNNSVTLKWDELDNTYGYYVFKWNDEEAKYECVNEATYATEGECVVSDLEAGKSYKFAVCGFFSNWQTGSRRLIYGDFTEIDAATTANEVITGYTVDNATVSLTPYNKEATVSVKYLPANANISNLDFSYKIADESVATVEKIEKENAAANELTFKITFAGAGKTKLVIKSNDEVALEKEIKIGCVEGKVSHDNITTTLNGYNNGTITFEGLEDESDIDGYYLLRTCTMVLKPYVFIPKTGAKTYSYTDTEVTNGTTYRYSVATALYDGTDYFFNQDYRECYMGHYLAYPKFVPAESISFDYESDMLMMNCGDEQQINAVINPQIEEGLSEEEAATVEPTYKDVYWKIDDESVASIETDGNKVTVKALKSGQTVLGAYTTDGSNVLKRVNVVVELLDITKATVLYGKEHTYIGRTIEPNVLVKMGDEVLEKDVDYKVTYKNNVAVGTAKIVVRGEGKYGGEKEYEFTIKEPETENTTKESVTETSGEDTTKESATETSGENTTKESATETTSEDTTKFEETTEESTEKKVVKVSRTTVRTAVTRGKAIKISWKRVKNATGYRVYRKTGKGRYKLIRTVRKGNTTYIYDRKISTKYVYTYKVKAYRGKTVSRDSNRITVRYLKTPRIKSAVKGNKKVTLKWNKVKGATGYKVYRKTGKGKYRLIARIRRGSKVSFVDRKIKPTATYTYRMVACYRNAQSSYSKTKKVTR